MKIIELEGPKSKLEKMEEKGNKKEKMRQAIKNGIQAWMVTPKFKKILFGLVGTPKGPK